MFSLIISIQINEKRHHVLVEAGGRAWTSSKTINTSEGRPDTYHFSELLIKRRERKIETTRRPSSAPYSIIQPWKPKTEKWWNLCNVASHSHKDGLSGKLK